MPAWITISLVSRNRSIPAVAAGLKHLSRRFQQKRRCDPLPPPGRTELRISWSAWAWLVNVYPWARNAAAYRGRWAAGGIDRRGSQGGEEGGRRRWATDAHRRDRERVAQKRRRHVSFAACAKSQETRPSRRRGRGGRSEEFHVTGATRFTGGQGGGAFGLASLHRGERVQVRAVNHQAETVHLLGHHNSTGRYHHHYRRGSYNRYHRAGYIQHHSAKHSVSHHRGSHHHGHKK